MVALRAKAVLADEELRTQVDWTCEVRTGPVKAVEAGLREDRSRNGRELGRVRLAEQASI